MNVDDGLRVQVPYRSLIPISPLVKTALTFELESAAGGIRLSATLRGDGLVRADAYSVVGSSVRECIRKLADSVEARTPDAESGPLRGTAMARGVAATLAVFLFGAPGR